MSEYPIAPGLTQNQCDCLRTVSRAMPLNGRYNTRTIRSLLDRGYIENTGVGYYLLTAKALALFPALDQPNPSAEG